MMPVRTRTLTEAADPNAPATVLKGSQRACAEAALVLAAKGIPYETLEIGAECELLVPQAQLAAARDELERYAQERAPVRRTRGVFTPFPGAEIGSGLYAAVLLLAAYCAGIQAFGADWFARGALDARPGAVSDWWRAVTALTLHLDQAHLLGNLLFGVAIGGLAGRAFGPGIAWASILAAASIANYADMLLSPSTHRAVGASTAVFAALGLLVGFAWRHGLTLRDQFKYAYAPVFGGVALLALLGAGDAHVDVLAHALGFVAGVATGWLYSRLGIPRSRGRGAQIAAGAAALVGVALAWALALRH
jgi:membrane associated rhomboid family serine protease